MKSSIFNILAIIALLMTSSSLLAQGVFVIQGPNGPVFSDKPVAGAKEVKLRPLNVMPAVPESKVPNVPPGPDLPLSEGGRQSVAESPNYDSFRIVAPENNGSMAANTAVFEVRLAVNPPLQLGEQHAFVISLNGKPVNQRFTATEFMVPPEFWEVLPPPNQALQLDASIVDGQGQVLKKAESVRFSLRYAAGGHHVLRPEPVRRPLHPPLRPEHKTVDEDNPEIPKTAPGGSAVLR